MKIFFLIVVLVVLISLSIAWGMKIWNNVTFGVNFKGAEFNQFNVDPLNGTFNANISLNLFIKNNNNFSIPFYNTKAWLYYNNISIAETSPNLANQSFRILRNSDKIYNETTKETTNGVTDKINIYGNAEAIKLAKQIISKQNPKINYTVQITVFGIPLTYSDFFIATI